MPQSKSVPFEVSRTGKQTLLFRGDEVIATFCGAGDPTLAELRASQVQHALRYAPEVTRTLESMTRLISDGGTTAAIALPAMRQHAIDLLARMRRDAAAINVSMVVA